jgi:hypothetical protein
MACSNNPCAAPEHHRDAAHRAFAVTDEQRLALQLAADAIGDGRNAGTGFPVPQPAEFLLAEAVVGNPAESPGQLRVVAELGMASSGR